MKAIMFFVVALAAAVAALSWPMTRAPVEFAVEGAPNDSYWRPIVVLHVDEPVSTWRYWRMLWDARQRGLKRIEIRTFAETDAEAMRKR